jgi:membrane protein YdbS with pleckstrin-like domain
MRARWHWSLPAVVILCLLFPLLFTGDTFSNDWPNHWWLIWEQGLDLGALHEPSYYLQSTLGAFYPYYAFYGGTFYAIAGAISKLISPEAAAVAAYLGALSASYLGWTWLARLAGVRGWRIQLPGAIAVTAPLAVTNLYGRGGIPEVVATAMLPLVAAAGTNFAREPRVRLRDAIAFVGALVILTGTHTLTLVWGVSFLALVGAILVACNWRFAVDRLMRLFGLACLAVLALCVNAWILGPLLLYRGRLIEQEPDPISQTGYTDVGNLFGLLRNAADLDPVVHADINAALPVLALLWAVVCGILFWRLIGPRSKALALSLAGLLVALVVLILSPSLIESLPEQVRYIQFPYRITTYANLCVVGCATLVLAALERAGSRARLPVALLAAVALFSLGISIVQNAEVRSWLGSRDEALASAASPPPVWYANLQFADGSAPIVKPTLPKPLLVPVEEGIRDSYRVIYPPGPAGTARTNIATGTYLVDVDGAVPVGRSEAGQMVVRLAASPDRPRVVTVAAEEGPAVTASHWISILALLLCGGGAAAVLLVRHRRR